MPDIQNEPECTRTDCIPIPEGVDPIEYIRKMVDYDIRKLEAAGFKRVYVEQDGDE